MNTQERQAGGTWSETQGGTCKQKMETRQRYTHTWEVRNKTQGESHKPDN